MVSQTNRLHKSRSHHLQYKRGIMPATTYPRNDAARLVSGQAALNSHSSDDGEGNAILMGKTATRLAAVVGLFQVEMNAIDLSMSDRMKEVREKNEALTRLEMYIRHCWNSVKMRVERNSEPVELLANYGLSSSGLIPKTSFTSTLTVIADQIVVGNAKTVEMGYASMVNPTIEELMAVNDAAKKEINEVAPADKVVDDASAKLSEVRSEIDMVLRDIVADLNYNLRYEDDSSRRRIMRRYGVEFRSDTAE